MGQQPQTRREIKEAERGRRGWLMPALVGVLAVAVLAGAVWLGKGLLTSTDPTGSPSAIAGASTTAPTSEATPTEEPSTEPSHRADAEPTVEPDPVIAAVASCRTAWRLQSAARADAYRAIGQWVRHLKIMNDLQANKITLAQAKAAWPATTAKAEENVAAFRAADKARAASQDAVCGRRRGHRPRGRRRAPVRSIDEGGRQHARQGPHRHRAVGDPPQGPVALQGRRHDAGSRRGRVAGQVEAGHRHRAGLHRSGPAGPAGGLHAAQLTVRSPPHQAQGRLGGRWGSSPMGAGSR